MTRLGYGEQSRQSGCSAASILSKLTIVEFSSKSNQICRCAVRKKNPPKAFETKMCGGTICARSTEL